MLFCACRAADVLNAFVGLWLVPKYVDPSELGAVQPLTQFANFLAIPVAALANTFRNELTHLSIRKELGKIKTLLRGIFLTTAIFLFAAMIVARFLLPVFLERIRIVEGSLGTIIIIASFLSAVSPIYSFALQALKKFKTTAAMHILSAPTRLITMIVAMPFRAISGYFVGQASVPCLTIASTIISLRKELSVPAETYWTPEVIHRFTKLFAFFLVSGSLGTLFLLVESTVLRQRLPDLDSAGYYMATRFSDIATFLFTTLAFTFFPFAAEKAAKGEDTRPLLIKSLVANAIFCFALALPFVFFGRTTLSLLPHGDKYAPYWWAIPWLIGISYLISIHGLYTTNEFSANRFQFLKWYLPFDLAYPVLLLIVTGHGYFTTIFPQGLTIFLTTHNIYSLETMLVWMTAINAIKAMACIIAMATQKSSKFTSKD